jgi:predicted ATP-grasp superfamily ATP-dependent carboligase
VRVLVCEYVTGGGFAGQALPEGLRHEGELMLRSLVRDLADVDGVDLLVSRDARLPAPGLPSELVPVAAGEDCWRVWAEAVAKVDAVWPVAPETGGILLRLSELAVRAGKMLLGSQPEAVRLCGSKLETASRLGECGIPVVPTRWLEAADTLSAGIGWVVKPDDGAGAEDILVGSRESLAAFGPSCGDWVVQPYLYGEAASLSLLCRDGETVLLACNSQHVTLVPVPPHPSCPDLIRASTSCSHPQKSWMAGSSPAMTGKGMRRFRYEGWTVGGTEASRSQYEALASNVAQAIPGLWGYVGIDLIETDAGPVILEINPRLTTTYAGLRDAIGQNPAALVLALASGGPLPTLGTVRPQHL